MIKIISIILYFIKELIFDSKDEYSFTNTNFNARKFTVFVILMLSITLNLFFFNRVFGLANINLELIKKVEAIETKVCEKNNKLVPSDSRKQ